MPSIVSLNPCSDAILAEVTAPGQLLAISHYSHDPAASSMDMVKARRFRSVSGSVEEIATLRPDIVVADTYIAPSTRAALEGLGIRVVTVSMASDIAASKAQVRELAALAGSPGRGEVLSARIDRAVRDAAPPSGRAPVPALMWESGGIVAGDGTLIADLMRKAGFVNAAAARGLSQADYLPLEKIVADPPAVIFAVGDPASESDRMLRHPVLRALGDTRRVRFASANVWCGGPVIPRALKRLGAARAAMDTGR